MRREKRPCLTDEQESLLDALSEFAETMGLKLMQAHHEGRRGWDNPRLRSEMEGRLRRCVDRFLSGDMAQAVDVANLAMMLSRLPAESVSERCRRANYQDCGNCDDFGCCDNTAQGKPVDGVDDVDGHGLTRTGTEAEG